MQISGRCLVQPVSIFTIYTMLSQQQACLDVFLSNQTRRHNFFPPPGVARIASHFSHVACSVVCVVTWQGVAAWIQSAVLFPFLPQSTEISSTPLSKLVRYGNERKGSRLNIVQIFLRYKTSVSDIFYVRFHALLGFALCARFPSNATQDNELTFFFFLPPPFFF